MDMNITFNHLQCLKTSANWGSDHYYNICNGVEKIVPWGSLDWTGAIGLGCIAGSLVAMGVAVIAATAYNIYEEVRL
jgi:hypothetical protein